MCVVQPKTVFFHDVQSMLLFVFLSTPGFLGLTRRLQEIYLSEIVDFHFGMKARASCGHEGPFRTSL